MAEAQAAAQKPLPPQHHPKQVELEVVWHSVGKFYKVTKIVNSSYYVPGEPIAPERLHLINEGVRADGEPLYPNWKVSAVDYDYFAAIAGLMGAAVGMATNRAMLPIP